MRRVHPFLSPLGIGVTIVTFLVLGLSFVLDGSAMFNPGELTARNETGQVLGDFESHAEFQGECQRCHAPLETTQADLCVRCHTNITKQAVDKTGTHGKIKNLAECRACHPDHQGRDFDLAAAAFRHFDHDLTNFTLTWHQVDFDLRPLACQDCHSQDERFQIDLVACRECHAGQVPDFMAQHVENLGDDCLACHDGSGNIANFDHTATQFPLEGSHAQIQCVDCHTGGRFDELPIECQACHEEPDVHAGLFAASCETCHTPVNWAALVGLDGQIFDHFKDTRFSLDRHLTNYAGEPVICADCHTSPDGLTVEFDLQSCLNCHASEDSFFMDEHQAQFGMDCLTCHDGVDRMHDFDHARIFALDGAHAETDCLSCHVNRVFSGTPSECASCHDEPQIHVGVFGLQCQSCHSTMAWSPAQMVEHTFPLDHGEDQLLSCETCHVDRYTEYTCYGCHEHQPGEIQSEHLEEGISQAELADCMACHPDGREHDE